MEEGMGAVVVTELPLDLAKGVALSSPGASCHARCVDASDEQVYAAWASGDLRAGGVLVDRYLGPMTRFFANKVSDRSVADDLVSETMKSCASSLGRFRGESSFRTYIYGIARNVLRTHIRKVGRMQNDPDLTVTAMKDVGPSASSVVGRKREHRLLLEALRSIPVDLQMILELSYFEDMSRRQIAETLDMPQGSVATKMARARKLLRQEMEAMAESTAVLESTVAGLDNWAHAVRKLMDEPSG